MTAMTFAIGGLAVWMPTYIYEREAAWKITPEVISDLAAASPPVPKEVLERLRPLQDREFRPYEKWDRRPRCGIHDRIGARC